MNPIRNVAANTPVAPAAPAKPAAAAAAPGQASPVRGKDKLELSGNAHLLQVLKKGTDVRADKVASIRAQLASGTYDDDAKLEAATDRLLDDVLK